MANVVKALLLDFNGKVLLHSPYSQGFTPTGFELFRLLNHHSHGLTFDIGQKCG